MLVWHATGLAVLEQRASSSSDRDRTPGMAIETGEAMKQLMMSVSMLVLVAPSVDAAPSGATIDAEVGVGRVGA
jgi:hypothetical protein